MLPARIPDFMENDEWYRYDEKERKYVLTEKAPKDAVESYDLLYKALYNRYYRVEDMLEQLPEYMVTATLFWIVCPLMDAHVMMNPDFYDADKEDEADPESIKPKASLLWAAKTAVENGLYMPCGLDENELGGYYVVHELGHMAQNRLFRDELVKRGWSQDDMMKFVDKSYTNPEDPRRYKWYYDVLKEVTARHRREIIAIAKKADPAFSEIRNLSKVAMMNDEEFFAEAYVNRQMSKPNAIGRAMDVWMKENGVKGYGEQ